MGCKDDVCLTFLDLVWINVVTLMSLDSVVDTVHRFISATRLLFTVDSKKSETLKKTYHKNRTCFRYL